MRRAQRHIQTVPEPDPRSADDVGIVFEEYLLRRAARDRVEAEQRLSDAIVMAKEAGYDRAAIWQILGVSPVLGGDRLDQAS